jgi:hypothetical protein
LRLFITQIISLKEKLVGDIATALEVSPRALNVPEFDSYVGLAHTLFALEDLYWLRIGEIDGEVCLLSDNFKGTTYLSTFDIFRAWNVWRYNYPKLTIINRVMNKEDING